MDQREIEARPDVLSFTSDALGQDTEVTGPVRVKLWACSSAPNTDFVVRLVDVFPDGRAFNLTDGIVRTDFEPNQPQELDIDLWATSNVFKAGHRIRVDVTSSSFPRWDRNPNTGPPLRRRRRGGDGAPDDPARRGARVARGAATGLGAAKRRGALARVYGMSSSIPRRIGSALGVTHGPNARHDFDARLHTDGTFQDVDVVRAETRDGVQVLDGGHELAIRFHSFDATDGINFHIDGGDRLRLALRLDDHLIGTEHIFLGPNGDHPEHNPFVLHR